MKNTILMLIEGYEMCSTKIDVDTKIGIHKPDYIDTIVPKMPISWVGCPFEEPHFDSFINASMANHTLEHQDKYTLLTIEWYKN